MKIFKEKYPHFDELVKQTLNIIETTPILNSNICPNGQLSIQTDKENSKDWFAGTGGAKGKFEWELSFDKLHLSIQGTPIEDYLKWLEVPVYRTRLMLTKPKFVYSIHRDYSPRLHLPLITNPQCYFLFKDPAEFIHMPADGRTYWIDTRKEHTFMNGSIENRFHLVMIVKE